MTFSTDYQKLTQHFETWGEDQQGHQRKQSGCVEMIEKLLSVIQAFISNEVIASQENTKILFLKILHVPS